MVQTESSPVQAGAPWQGGTSKLIFPPSLPAFGSGALAIVSQSDSSSGTVVSYLGGIFTSQFWSTGHAVPFLIRDLNAEEIGTIRDQVSDQLKGPSTGLDEVPLRAFVEAATVYLAARSGRFTGALFGPISEFAAEEFLGAVTWACGTVGTVVASQQGVSAQTHIPPQTAGPPAALRKGDLQSLISALRKALRARGGSVDPAWQQCWGTRRRRPPQRCHRPRRFEPRAEHRGRR